MIWRARWKKQSLDTDYNHSSGRRIKQIEVQQGQDQAMTGSPRLTLLLSIAAHGRYGYSNASARLGFLAPGSSPSRLAFRRK